MDKTEFYRHDQNWTNRMILGDSLQVMASLAEREGLRGKVQCIVSFRQALHEFQRQDRYAVCPAYWVKPRPCTGAVGAGQEGETDGRGRRCSGGSGGDGRPGPLASGRGGVIGVLRTRRGATGGPGRGWRPQSGAGSASVLARAARVAVSFHGI